jgi:hypothetical protein
MAGLHHRNGGVLICIKSLAFLNVRTLPITAHFSVEQQTVLKIRPENTRAYPQPLSDSP